MAIVINDVDGTIQYIDEPDQFILSNDTQIVVSDPITSVIFDDSAQQLVITAPAEQTIIVDEVSIVIQSVSSADLGDMFIINHSATQNLLSDDHTQYHNDVRGDLRYTPLNHVTGVDVNPHSLSAAELPGLSTWGLRVTPADQQFIIDNLELDAIPSTRIGSLVAGKIAAGVMAAKVSLADVFTASAQGSVFNDDESALALGANRMQMGFVSDAINTYMLRHSNGYADNHGSYVSNFGIDEFGNVYVAGTLTVGSSSSGIAQFSDAGVLVTRDTTTYYALSTNPPGDPIAGDIWYKTDLENAAVRYSGAIWQSIKDGDILIAQGAADGKIQTYFTAVEPTGLSALDNGDLWFDTGNGNIVKYYNHTAFPQWIDAQDSDIAQGLLDASTAQATADGKVTTYTGVEPVTVEGIGDLWHDSVNKLLKRTTTAPTPTWEVASNSFDDTNLLVDSANLGGTADWSTIVDDNGALPADNADVTDVGGSNYVIRGLGLPNTSSGVIAIVAGASDWGIELIDSSTVTKIIAFDIPPLLANTNYVVSFWAFTDTSGADFFVDLFPDSLPEFIVTVTATSSAPDFYTYVFSSVDAINMAIADLRFFRTTGSTSPLANVTIYDIKFEKGAQATDWTPFNPSMDLADGTKSALENVTTISQGGIVLSTGGSLKSLNKDAYGDVTPGIFIGWDATEADYTLDIGDGTDFIKWDGTALSVAGSISITNPISVRTELNVADGATAGADWDTDILNMPPDSELLNISDGTTWGFNGAFDWINGNTYPINWASWGTVAPVRELAITRIGSNAVKFVSDGTDQGMIYTYVFSSAPPLGSFVTGSIDIYLEAFTSGGTGLLVDVGYDATFQRTFVPRTTATVGSWATIPFTAKVPTNKLITYIRIYVMGSYTAMTGGALIGTVIFDALTLRLDNLVPADIGYIGALDADVTEDALTVGTTITGGGITLSAGGNIKGGQTSYDTGTGFFLGYEAGAYLFSIGNGTDRVSWDGTSLKVAGNITITNPATVRTDLNVADGADVTQAALITGTTITGGGITLSAGGNIKGGQTAYATGTGFFLGYEATKYKFSIGSVNSYLKWDAALEVRTGDITVKGIDINPGGDNEMHFHGDNGNAVVEELANIGISANIDTDNVVGLFGTSTTGNSLVGVEGRSNSKTGVYGRSNSGVAVNARSITGTAVFASSGGILGMFVAATGVGGIGIRASGSSNGVSGAPLHLNPGSSASAPTHVALKGSIWLTSTTARYVNNNGTTGWTAF